MPHPKAKRSTEESLRIRKDIVARLEAGETQAGIALATGVSRQYVHILRKEIEAAGAENVLSKASRGAPRYIPLTRDEAKLMRIAMSTTRPADYGWGGDEQWTLATVKKWTKANLDRVYNARRVRYFFKKWSLQLGDPLPRDPYTEAAAEALEGDDYQDPPEAVRPALAEPLPPRRKRGRPRKNPLPVDPLDEDLAGDSGDFPSLEDMRKSIAEWQAKQKNTTVAAAGQRPRSRGPHRTPSKKKRRKK